MSAGDDSENEQDSESGASSKDDDKKKKKSKHKKKEKHRRKKETKVDVEEINKSDQSTKNILKEPNEISGRDILGLKTTIDPDEIPEIPAHKFLMRGSLTDNNTTNTNNNTNNNEASNTR